MPLKQNIDKAKPAGFDAVLARTASTKPIWLNVQTRRSRLVTVVSSAE